MTSSISRRQCVKRVVDPHTTGTGGNTALARPVNRPEARNAEAIQQVTGLGDSAGACDRGGALSGRRSVGKPTSSASARWCISTTPAGSVSNIGANADFGGEHDASRFPCRDHEGANRRGTQQGGQCSPSASRRAGPPCAAAGRDTAGTATSAAPARPAPAGAQGRGGVRRGWLNGGMRRASARRRPSSARSSAGTSCRQDDKSRVGGVTDSRLRRRQADGST